MKIQASRAEEFSATSQAQATDRPRTNGTGSGPNGAGQARVMDRFEASSDARLADLAIKAVHDAPDIRPEVVERAKQKLLSGELGADVERLAGRMIDAMLG